MNGHTRLFGGDDTPRDEFEDDRTPHDAKDSCAGPSGDRDAPCEAWDGRVNYVLRTIMRYFYCQLCFTLELEKSNKLHVMMFYFYLRSRFTSKFKILRIMFYICFRKKCLLHIYVFYSHIDTYFIQFHVLHLSSSN